MIRKTLILRTYSGRWTWWPDLQCVDYVPKGKRLAEHTLYLSSRQNTEIAALRAVAGYLSEFWWKS